MDRRPIPTDLPRRRLLAAAATTFAAASAPALSEPLAAGAPSRGDGSGVIELRQYTLHAGGRDRLIDLFERAFIEPQDAVGIEVFGQFRDLDDPNRFVWLRGFPDMERRAPALAAFYGGPVWKAHRSEANATMVDSDNVLLLRLAGRDGAFASVPPRPPLGAPPAPARLISAHIHYIAPAAADAFAQFFAERMQPDIEAAGAPVLGRFLTETSANNFPGLPIREGESVFVWLAAHADAPAFQAWQTALMQGPDWRDGASELLLRQFARKPEVLRLAPCSRSRLR